jgi:hypothetical protein
MEDVNSNLYFELILLIVLLKLILIIYLLEVRNSVHQLFISMAIYFNWITDLVSNHILTHQIHSLM